VYLASWKVGRKTFQPVRLYLVGLEYPWRYPDIHQDFEEKRVSATKDGNWAAQTQAGLGQAFHGFFYLGLA
jgi:hypothetical protein